MVPRPGEVSLSHNGVLFLDELPEFPRNVLEVMRQPLEDGTVTIARAAMSLTFPARFMLAAAMNPCPCGFFNDRSRECHCTPPMIQRYMSKISGPLLDRIDIHIDIPAVNYKELRGGATPEDSASIRARVLRAREVQLARFKAVGEKIYSNAQMGSRHIRQFCDLSADCERLLERAMTQQGLSARAHDRILKALADDRGLGRRQPDRGEAHRRSHPVPQPGPELLGVGPGRARCRRGIISANACLRQLRFIQVQGRSITRVRLSCTNAVLQRRRFDRNDVETVIANTWEHRASRPAC